MSTVLQVIGDGSAGGGTTAVLGLSLGLAARGRAVEIATQAGSYLAGEARKAGLPTLELDFRRRRDSWRAARALASRLEAIGPAVLHAHGARAGLPAALVPRARRAAFVYTVHGFHFVRRPTGVRQLARAVERFCIRRSSATVFVSEGDRRIALGDGLADRNDAHEVIYNGGAPPRHQHASGAPAFDIAFLGRLHFQKNPLILPEILLALRPLRPTICIIGGGEVEAALRARVTEAGLDGQFAFLGTQAHTDALAHLARARLMLLPSRWEGLPISVIEAMHLGVPVVASNVAGTDELVRDGETGYLIGSDDVAAYAAAIGRILADADLQRRMAAAAMARAAADFSIERNIARHIALYDRLAGSRRDQRAA